MPMLPLRLSPLSRSTALRRSALAAVTLASFLAGGALAQEAKEPAAKKWDVNHPPGKAAIVPIDTATGTWMSVDVSPDGKTLVFDLLGDLYTLPIEGGEAKALTHSIAWEMQPRFSPDGKRIAYVSDAGGGDNVWVMNADGSGAREVSRETYRLLNNPVWHPGGEYIAARKHYAGTRSLGSGEIWLFHAPAVPASALSSAPPGGRAAKLEGVALNDKPNWQKDLGEPAFSPDGAYLYYSQDTTPGTTFEYNKDGNKQIYQIFRRDMATGKTVAFAGGPGGAVRPTPSPDGKTLAFVRRVRNQSTLFLKDLKTGRESAVWSKLDRDMQESWAIHGVYPAFAWMPGGREIVVWAQGRLWRVDPFRQTEKEIPFRVRHTREVREALRERVEVAPDRFDVKQLRWANVSPQGDRVVYSALGALYLRSLPDGEPVRLTRQTTHWEFFPRFSRDGRRVVYTTWNDQTLGSVRSIDLATQRETVIVAEPGHYLEPAFSPDGRAVAYVKTRAGGLTAPWYGFDTGVYLAAADGGGVPRLLSEEGRAPQFAADSEHVYVTRTRTTGEVDWTTELVRLKHDKSEEHVVAKADLASDYAISPDGKWLAFRERFQVYAIPFPATGRALAVGKKMTALPVRRLSDDAGDALHWSGDSRRVHFSLGDELFSRAVDEDAATAPPPRRIGFAQAADRPVATVALSGARIATMKGDEVIDNGRVVVRGNRIAAIGPAAEVPVPPGARDIDVRGKTIIPGLIDVHWHGAMGSQGIIPQQSWVNYASLAFGVTTLHDPSNDTQTIFTQAEMQRAGLTVAPRIFSTGTILYGAKSTVTAEVDNLDDALTHLRRMKAAGARTVKSYNQPRRDQRQQLIEAARRTGMMVVPEGGSLFQMNMNMIVDGHTGIEHAIPVAHAYDDVKQLWAGTRVGYTPTFVVAFGGLDGEHYWYARTDVWQHPLLSRYVPRAQLAARAVRRETAPDEDFNVLETAKTATAFARAGVNVNIGAHGQREGLAAHWEMWTYVKGGMSPLEAIRAATLNGARYLGMDGDIGSLEVGKLADLVVIDGDVLADIRQSDRVAQVMQNGRLFDAKTMNEIGATPRPRRPFFFERGDGSSADADALAAAHDAGRCGCQ